MGIFISQILEFTPTHKLTPLHHSLYNLLTHKAHVERKSGKRVHLPLFFQNSPHPSCELNWFLCIPNAHQPQNFKAAPFPALRLEWVIKYPPHTMATKVRYFVLTFF